MHDPDAELTDRARAGLHVARWDPVRIEAWASVLRELWERGLSVADLSGEDEQLALLRSSHAAGVESDAILSALDSRFASVRAEAEVLLEHLDERGREALRATFGDGSRDPWWPAAAPLEVPRSRRAAPRAARGRAVAHAHIKG